jgi:hypothetical protein
MEPILEATRKTIHKSGSSAIYANPRNARGKASLSCPGWFCRQIAVHMKPCLTILSQLSGLSGFRWGQAHFGLVLKYLQIHIPGAFNNGHDHSERFSPPANNQIPAQWF